METKYVIEKMDDVTRVWWTGTEWSDVDTDALWYDDRPDAIAETDDAAAIATGFEI